MLQVFLFPETRFNRPSSRSSNGSVTTAEDVEAKRHEIQSANQTSTTVTTNKDEKLQTSATSALRQGHNAMPALPVGKPSKAQFSLIPRPQFEGGDIIFRDIVAPIQIFTFPIICWAAFTFCFASNSLLSLNLTQSQVFAAPPYLFNPAQVGFVNFAFVVGGVTGLLTAGPFSDWFSMRATILNNGVREAEMRLIALVPYIALNIIGMTVSFVFES